MFNPGSGNTLEREIGAIADDLAFKVGADFSSNYGCALSGLAFAPLMESS
jgi:hypothetical protein